MTDHFTFKELTITTEEDLLAENIKEGSSYLGNLLLVAGELEKVRAFFNAPVKVNSAFRCAALNKRVGGSATSQHTKGAAADFTVTGYEDPNGLRFVFEWCRNNTSFSQLIFERPEGKKPWIHLGIAVKEKSPEVLEFDGKKYHNV